MQQTIDSFLAWLVEEKGSTDNTIAAYRNDMGQFLDFLSASTAVEAWSGVTDADIRAYLAELQAREYAPATVARKIAAVRSFFHYLVLTEVLDDDPTVQVTASVQDRQSPEQLARQAARRLWDSIPASTPLDLRDRALVALVAGVGLKTSQAVALDLDDVDLQLVGGTVQVHGRSETKAKVLSRAVAGDLARYVNEGRPLLDRGAGEAPEAEQPLFLNARGQRLSRHGIWLVLKARGEAAELGREVSPRALRGVLATAGD